MKTYILTGDVGGTNSRMSLYDGDDSSSYTTEPILVKYYRNYDAMPEETLGEKDTFQNNIIAPFLKEASLGGEEDHQIIACLAIAGIVLDNAVHVTNLKNLLIDGNAIAASTDGVLKNIVQCKIINDFVAQGYGCLTLKDDEVRKLGGPCDTLQDLPMNAPKVCVGAGSGLGECYLTPSTEDPDNTNYTCFPSEGGHVEYAPRNEEEMKLWSFLSFKFASKDRVSVERIVSGTGLGNVYEFLSKTYPKEESAEIRDVFKNADRDEKGKVVGMNATKDKLCRRAMDIMMTTYGSEVGSSAIKWIPRGGLFVTGGITPKNIQFIEGENSKFMTAYQHKGRVSPILKHVPLYAVMVEDLGVRGVHKAALMMMQKAEQERKKKEDEEEAKNRKKEQQQTRTTTAVAKSKESSSSSLEKQLLTNWLVVGAGAVATALLLRSKKR